MVLDQNGTELESPLAFMTHIGTLLQKANSFYQKYHLTTMAPGINCSHQKWHLVKMVSHDLLHQLVLAVHIKFYSLTRTPIFTASTYEG